MSLELIYTSAPKGLKPGSRGFCTVAMTQGLPPQLVDRLEALSGYRQIFPPQDPQAGLNPIVYSHLRISVAGRNYHILSRICAAGLDYSQRANKFAAHQALDASELPPAGPAWLLTAPGFLATTWDGTPKLLPARRASSGNVGPAVCRHWQQLTGDAGWGGVLAEAAIQNPRSTATIIFQPGQDPLPLLAESLALLPPDLRWGVTFSTYFTKLPPGVECRWRCAIQGSPEAKAPGLVLDLCRKLGQPPASPYVTAARTGHLPVVAAPTRPVAVPFAADESDLARLLADPDAAPTTNVLQQSGPSNDSPYTLQSLPPMLPANLAAASGGALLTTKRFKRKESAKWPYILGTLAAAIIVTACCVAFWVASHGDAGPVETAQIDPPSKNSSAVSSGEKSPRPVGSANTDDGRTSRKPGNPTDEPHKTRPVPGPTNSEKHNSQSDGEKHPATPDSPPGNSEKQAAIPAATPIDPLADIKNRRAVGIPELKAQSAIGGDRTKSLERRLGRIFPADAKELSFELVGQLDADEQVTFNLPQRGETNTTGDTRWACNGGWKGGHGDIAEFVLDAKGELMFRWLPDSDPPEVVNTLCNKLLKITTGDRKWTALVPLRSPIRVEPLQFSKLIRDEHFKEIIPILERYLPPKTEFHFEILKPSSPQQFPPATIEQANNQGVVTMNVDSSPMTIRVAMPPIKGDETLRIVVDYDGVRIQQDDWHDIRKGNGFLVNNSTFKLTPKLVDKHWENRLSTKNVDELKLELKEKTTTLDNLNKKEKPSGDDTTNVNRLKIEIPDVRRTLAARELKELFDRLQRPDCFLCYRVFYVVELEHNRTVDIELISMREQTDGKTAAEKDNPR